MNGMTSDPRDHEAFVREIDLGHMNPAVSSLPEESFRAARDDVEGNILAPN